MIGEALESVPEANLINALNNKDSVAKSEPCGYNPAKC